MCLAYPKRAGSEGVRLCMVSDLAAGVLPEAAILGDATRTWAQQGHEVYWLAPPHVLQEPCVQAAGCALAAESLPPTCRYVIPVQAYAYEGVSLYCVPQEIWQRADLHTRLFTFLSLLYRAGRYEMLHAWGSVPVAYLTGYTACYLAVPAVVSAPQEPCMPGAQASFLWPWVVRHATMWPVPRLVERRSPVAGVVHGLGGEPADASQELLRLYARLLAASQHEG